MTAAGTAATVLAVLVATQVAPGKVPLGIVLRGAILGTGTACSRWIWCSPTAPRAQGCA